ncbi:MAG: hypothetical protein VB087_10815 [Candidatus Limiplasma sp.]|nr:hypothetical protein [Candidatus Limiplasma sp.]
MNRINHRNYACDFVAYITLQNGKRIYAKDYGKKAFCIPKNRRAK